MYLTVALVSMEIQPTEHAKVANLHVESALRLQQVAPSALIIIICSLKHVRLTVEQESMVIRPIGLAGNVFQSARIALVPRCMIAQAAPHLASY